MHKLQFPAEKINVPFHISLEILFQQGHYCPVKAGKSVFEIVET